MLKKYFFFLFSCLLCGMCAAGLAAPTLQVVLTGIDKYPELSKEIDSKLQHYFIRLDDDILSSDKHAFSKSAQNIISTNLKAHGFFEARQTVTINETNSGYFSLKSTIHLGPRVHYRHVQVSLSGEGPFDSVLTNFRDHFPLKSGKAFNNVRYENVKARWLQLAEDQGYLFPHYLAHVVDVNIKSHIADIILVLSPGKRYTFGKINIQSTEYNPRFIKRFITFSENQTYDPNAILKTEQNLTSSGYFSNANIVPNLSNKQQTSIPIQIRTQAVKSQKYIFGIGYGTDTGPRTNLGWRWLRVNRMGNQFETQLQFSQIAHGALAKYTIPGGNPLKDKYFLTAGYNSQHTPVGRTRLASVGLTYQDAYHQHWTRNLSLSFQNEMYKAENEKGRFDNYLLPSISWVYLKTDNPIFTRNGSKMSFMLRGSPKLPYSTVTFAQGRFDGKWILSPLRRTRFILNSALGLTSVEAFDRMPLTLRFSTGGDRSLRGYNYQSVGPGRYLKLLSLEGQFRIFHRFYLAAFYDMGNASKKFDEPLKRAAGYGIMYASPIGPIEITLAKAISKQRQPMRIQFSMGPDLS